MVQGHMMVQITSSLKKIPQVASACFCLTCLFVPKNFLPGDQNALHEIDGQTMNYWMDINCDTKPMSNEIADIPVGEYPFE